MLKLNHTKLPVPSTINVYQKSEPLGGRTNLVTDRYSQSA